MREKTPNFPPVESMNFDKIHSELEREVEKYGKNTWSKSEIGILRDFYTRIPSRIIAQKLGRTETSIYKKARKLGLSRDVGTHFILKKGRRKNDFSN